MSEKVTASLSLMRRLPPNKVEKNLNGLLNLVPEEVDELLQRIDQPLKVGVDPSNVSTFFSISISFFFVLSIFFSFFFSFFFFFLFYYLQLFN